MYRVLFMAIASGIGIGAMLCAVSEFQKFSKENRIGLSNNWQGLLAGLHDGVFIFSLAIPSLFAGRYMGNRADVNEWILVSIMILFSAGTFFIDKKWRGGSGI